jgi:membrane-associated phospholipid phosphatase
MTLSRWEKPLLFLWLYVVWAFVYFGVGAWNAGRTAGTLAWDPVWAFPLVPAFVFVYLSAFVMPFFAAAAVRDRERFHRYALMLMLTIIACAAVFMAWRLTIWRPAVAGTDAASRLLVWLYRVDKPVNLFPSLHVALAFLFAKMIGAERPRWWAPALLWALLIAVSTLFTRQHYLIDVLGGVVVAYAAWGFLRLTSRGR